MARSESLAERVERLSREAASAADPRPVLEELQRVSSAVVAEQRIAAIDAQVEALLREREGHVQTVELVQPQRSKRARS